MNQSVLIRFSAATASDLDAATAELVRRLTADPSTVKPVDTDTAGPLRRAFVCRHSDDAIALASSPSHRRVMTGTADADFTVAFMFPGTGDQYPGMALDLYQTNQVFRSHVDECHTLLTRRLGFDLRNLMYPDNTSAARPNLLAMLRRGEPDPAQQALDRTIIAHLSTFVIEYAVARTLAQYGIHPAALIGHSLGEITAACVAGVLTLEDALALLVSRAEAVESLPTGAMLAVLLPEAEVRGFTTESLSLAAVNSPGLCVLAGPPNEVEALEQRLSRDGIATQRLQVEHAFHSAQMRLLADQLRPTVAALDLRTPKIPFVSGISGDWITAAEARSPEYWVRHVAEPIQFAAGFATIAGQHRVLLEVGPGRTLCSFGSAIDASPATTLVPTVPPRHHQASATETLLAAIGRLWTLGADVDWVALDGSMAG